MKVKQLCYDCTTRKKQGFHAETQAGLVGVFSKDQRQARPGAAMAPTRSARLGHHAGGFTNRTVDFGAAFEADRRAVVTRADTIPS
jgi:hypothetical protein